MDFTDLNLFIKLTETKNFAKTATQNHMSPSTLSRQIQRMEEELGKILFIRDNRQVNLTEYGEMFLQFAKAEWQNWQQFKQQLNDELDELSGELKLFCSVTASYSHLPQVLKQFRQRYPKVEIQLTTGDPALALELVQSQQADIALAGKPNNLPASVVFHKIDDIHLSLIAPRVACLATQLLQEKPINWQQMPFIFPVEGQARQRIEQWLREKQIKHPKIYATVAGHEGIVPMVGLGFGLAMLPDAVIDNSPMRDQISHLNLDVPVAPFELGIYTQKRNLVQPLIRAFWAMLE
ncbi:HTH-type transcriptional activator IlvY [Rodentibacter pneumotropicus]|uniref:HTH-type transcriptional activator IlvY n=1 Tax=Rodentibacter pneumotropicus TaxID=758 RepID=A0A4V3SND4_9PAST|nr:HTH-type transcriptional activator IlvY [Rodentibacter pneumotropicus]TGZ98130.1 HTH-type transcriptional activator IlvY [Rodentibacter pneumotropicus]TGZ99125.1 HTH-type transcriptional activator IlvY [Rodentibacter pneumotropicus]THA05037.1 HTH-type transcriptional activator IlvY [Rodentibacter pneumotropicus]THA13698.1 HTH-type transcriptional activator IlvY [Rodentibacter pneumotropicus]